MTDAEMTPMQRIKLTSYRPDGLAVRRWRVVDTRHNATIYEGPNETLARELRNKAVAELYRIADMNAKAVRP